MLLCGWTQDTGPLLLAFLQPASPAASQPHLATTQHSHPFLHNLFTTTTPSSHCRVPFNDRASVGCLAHTSSDSPHLCLLKRGLLNNAARTLHRQASLTALFGTGTRITCLLRHRISSRGRDVVDLLAQHGGSTTGNLPRFGLTTTGILRAFATFRP